MPRSIWSGTISFGLVSVPVRMYSATESRELRFHFLDKHDLQPIGYDKVRRDTGEHVDDEDIVRGFEVEKGRYVPLEDEDLDRLDIELTKTIDICDFVDLDQIDPIYFRKAYYLAPQEGAEKPYRLLVRALEETGKVAIAKIVIRNKQHLAALRPVRPDTVAARAKTTTRSKNASGGETERVARSGTLVLETMYYADEVREPEKADGKVQVRKPEVEMAKSLVENLSARFDPKKYDDTYRKELLQLLRAKAKGKPLPEPEEEPEGEVVDLMAALRESVEKTKRGRTSRPRKRSRAKKAS
jgi:DNA end-binding protein Ku